MKRRIAKARNPLITPEAVALFRRGLELQGIGADDIDDDSDVAEEDRQEYSAVIRRLHWGLLHIAPSDAGPLDVYPGMEPDGSEFYRASIPRALELRALLQKGKPS
ncbi:MAG: hypothetical protein ACJ8EL_08265 [Rhizomicrobium sp.]